MQSEIISEIIEVEETATKTVNSAREESNKLINEAQMKANTALRKAVKNKRLENNEIIDNLRVDHTEKIKKYEKKIQSSYTLDYDLIDNLAEKISTKICLSSVFDK